MEDEKFFPDHKKVLEVHIIFDNPLEINDKTKAGSLEKGIEDVVKKLKVTLKDLKKTPTK